MASFDQLQAWYREIRRIRSIEEVISEAYRTDLLPGLLHLSVGGEAVAVGVIGQLADDDRVYSTHRGHGHFLASGTDPESLMAELAGRDNGLCRGRGGSMHLMDRRAVLATGVVGGSLPIALGHALALAPPAIAVAFFGDGAVQAGVFHETMNLVSLWNVRLLMVCENNGWAEFSSREEHTKVRSVADHGATYGIEALEVDGTDVEAVAGAAARMVESVRAGNGPALLECHINRIRSHYEGDLRRAGPADGDPVDVLARRLIEAGANAADLERVDSAERIDAAACLTRALAGPVADPADDAGLVFRTRS